MTKSKSLAITALSLSLLCGCAGGNTENAVPLPEAFPRPYVYPDSFKSIAFGDISLDVNAEADIAYVNNGINITYPRYGATLFIGIKRNIPDSASFAAEWANRQQRLSLNLGPAASTASVQNSTIGTPHPFCLVRANSTVQTPVQAIAGCPQKGVLMSAVAFMADWTTSTPYDSIKPVTDILERDLRHSILSIRYGKDNN